MTDKRELLHEPDAAKWAAAFKRTFPESDEELMLGWFANAMMAMHDWLLFGEGQGKAIAAWNTRPASGDAVEELRERVRHWREMPSLMPAVDLIADMERALDTLTTEAPAPAKVCDAFSDAVEALRKIAGFKCEPGTEDGAFFSCRLIAKTALTTEAPAQTEAKALADELCTLAINANADIPNENDRLRYVAALHRAAATLRQPASEAVKPVAWMYERTNIADGNRPFQKRRWVEDVMLVRPNDDVPWQRNVRPLYTHPPADAESVALRLGDVVAFADHIPGAELWRRENGKYRVVGLWDETQRINVTVAPVEPNGEGPTDGFYIARTDGKPDDLARIDAHLADKVQS